MQVHVVGKRFLSHKKIRIENHQSQPTSMTFWPARETNTQENCLWLAHFSRSQTRCLAVSDRLILSSWFNIAFLYYHLRSTVKRERFSAHVYFSNETVSQTTVSTGPMKMFRLEHETMNVCQRNVTRFAHVECMFDKINDVFQGFGSFVSLRLQKDGHAKSQQIWTNLSHWNTDGLSSRCEDLLFFQSWSERSAFETWHGYRCHLLLHNDRVSLRETWLWPFSIWRGYVTTVWIYKGLYGKC